MADKEKKIRLGVDSTGVSQELEKLRIEAERVARRLIDGSREQERAGKDALQYIEEQIKAIERKNRLEAEGRLTSVKRDAVAGTITPVQAGTMEQQIRGQYMQRVDLTDQIRRNVQQFNQPQVGTAPERTDQPQRPSGADLDRNKFEEVKRGAEDLARELISSSRKYTTSAREVIQNIEDEIKAIERKNRINETTEKLNLRSQFDRGDISESKFKERSKELSSDVGSDKLQVQLLRELIDTIKLSAKQEIQERREHVERTLQESKTLQQLAPEGDEFEILKETVQQYEVGRLGKEEREQKQDFQPIGKATNLAGAMMRSDNIYEAGLSGAQQAAHGASSHAILGPAAAIIGLAITGALMAVRATRPYEESLGATYATTGRQMEGFGKGFSSYGYTMDQTVARYGQISRARGTTAGSARATGDALLMQRGMGLEASQVDEMERLGRGDVSGFSTRQLVQGTIGGMRGIGAVENNDLSLLPEYLQTLTQLGQEQVRRLGNVDIGVNSRMITAIAGLDESFKNPQVLQGLVTSLYSGLTGSQNQQTEALQYSVLNRVNPQASMFQLMKMREDPFSKESQEYLPKYLETLRGISGGNDEMFYMQIKQQFGLSASMSEKLGRGFTEGDGNLQRVLAEGFDASGGVNLEGRAGGATGAIMEATAKWTNTLQDVGANIVEQLKQLEKLDKLINGFTTGFGQVVNAISADHERRMETSAEMEEVIRDTGSGIERAILRSGQSRQLGRPGR